MSTIFAPQAELTLGHPSTPRWGVRMRAAVSSEWIKLRSVRSTPVGFLAAAGLMVLFAVVVAVSVSDQWPHENAAQHAIFDPTHQMLQGFLLVQAFVATMGVLVAANEYGNGLIRATLTATPQRGVVLAAKAIPLGLAALLTSLVACVGSFVLGQLFLTRGAPHASLSDPHVLRAVLGTAVYLTLSALLGLAGGFLLRSTATAIAGMFVVLLILPIITGGLPDAVKRHIYPYLPSEAGQTISYAHGSDPYALGPWTGLAVLTGYVSLGLLAAWWLLRRRDT